ncbi:uncharacterized protein LOC119732793 [Patiria miniata]|uniref:Transposase n=1 Tax=Patiria miniata TaxID=46514 RepID=A0A914AEG5_PATMI|nr:uncharacterized protein LOC119732793 [Patiria miniata]
MSGPELQDLCRLCGVLRRSESHRNPTRKEDVSKIIRAGLNINVEEDVTGIHPPYICRPCEMKLRRWWDATKKKKKASLNIKVSNFPRGEGISSQSTTATLAKVEWEEAARSAGLNTWLTDSRLQVMKMDGEGMPSVFFTVFDDCTWRLIVAGIVAQGDLPVCCGHPRVLSVEDFQDMLRKLSSLFVCEGNKDLHGVVEARKGAEGQMPIRITANDIYCQGTVRHIKCLLLSNRPRCDVCRIHRSDLMVLASREKGKLFKDVSVDSTIPNKNLTNQQLQQKVSLLQTERRNLKRRSLALKDKVASMLEKENVAVDGIQHKQLSATVGDCDDEMKKILGLSSPARLLWEQQKESALKGKQMRWHPAIIRWCIALQSKSSAGYGLLRDSGFLKLPHPSTLHSYSHFASLTTGLYASMLARIYQDWHLETVPEFERNVSLLFDEMKVKAGLAFSVRSGKIMGFTDLGSVANEIAAFERRCRGDEEPTIATHVMVLMVRGIFSSLRAPVAYFPTTGITGDQLYPCMWEAVLWLETAGLQVRGLVSDGASPNRKFYRLHGESSETSVPTYCTPNPFDPNRKIFFLCDVPHLLKTTRNNFENSGYNRQTRTLCYHKQDIKWTQLLQLYEWDVGLDRHSPGLRRLHKITYEHLHLTPSLRMRVYMAAQVMSSTVANTLDAQMKAGKVGLESTIKFIRYIDDFFDCLNVSNAYDYARLRKPNLEPYISAEDKRFDWLMHDFLGFLDEWEAEVESHPALDKTAKAKMILSKETLKGMRITVHSFVELGRLLLKLPGVTFLLSEKFNQDPLEQYFSKQRGTGGCSDSPTVEQFGHNMQALYVASSCVKASKRGNCKVQGADEVAALDSTPLPRRK